jgi:hypothetical protein
MTHYIATTLHICENDTVHSHVVEDKVTSQCSSCLYQQFTSLIEQKLVIPLCRSLFLIVSQCYIALFSVVLVMPPQASLQRTKHMGVRSVLTCRVRHRNRSKFWNSVCGIHTCVECNIMEEQYFRYLNLSYMSFQFS